MAAFWRAQHGSGIPRLVAPQTVHAAFHKAANYFGLTLDLVPVDLQKLVRYCARLTPSQLHHGSGWSTGDPDADTTDLSTWTLTFLMLAGRLELFTVILLLMPSFWRK